jgi:transglutaminase-like putative cysteine protease
MIDFQKFNKKSMSLTNHIELKNYLKTTEFLDFDSQEVQDFVEKYTKPQQTDVQKAVALYNAVRDGFFYNPYKLDLRRNGLKASTLLKRDYGYCVEKAVLLAAAARCVGIPSRLVFANVRNHIATEKLEIILQTNIMVFHGSTELFLEGKWVKATPAFNKTLCEKLNVAPLEFTGKEDSMFQEYDKKGRKYMEYLHQYGSFEDLPYNLFLAELAKYYGHLIGKNKNESEGLFIEFEGETLL